MALKSLFNLDPTKYSIKESPGSFRRVGEVNNRLDGINVVKLLEGLTAPTEPTLAPVTHKASDLQKQADAFKNQALSLLTQGRDLSSSFGVLTTLAKMKENFDAREYSRPELYGGENEGNIRTLANLQNQYLSSRNALQSKVDEYNSQIRANETAVSSYNKQVAAFNKEKNSRLDSVYAALVDPTLISGETSATSGQRLGATELYSDDLHRLMLERVGQRNAEEKLAAAAGPVAGSSSMSSLFTR